MENSVLRGCSVHPVRLEIRPVALKKRTPSRCQSPRGLVVSNQQRNQRVCKAISNSLLLRNITNRRHSNNKKWTSKTVKDTHFLTKPVLQKQPRIIRMGLGSETGKEPEPALSSTNRRNSTWSLSDNLRCVISLHISNFRLFSVYTLKDLSLTIFLCVLSARYSRQMNWAWISP